MKNKKVFLIFITIILFMFSLVGCGKSNMLTLNLKKGEKYKITATVNQKIVMSTVNQNEVTSGSTKVVVPDIETNEETTTGYVYNIADVDKDGTVTVKVSYDFIKVKTSSAGQTSEIDTRKDGWKNTPVGKICAEMLNDGFTLEIFKNGKVKSITGINKTIDMVINSMDLDAAQKESFSKTIKENFGEESVKGTFNGITNIYPNKEIKKGVSWNIEEKLSVGIPITMSTDWEIKDIKDGTVTATTNSKITTDANAAPLDFLGIKMNYNVKGTQKGNVKINQGNGFMQSGEFKQNLSGTANMTIPKSSSMEEQKIIAPMTCESTFKYQIEKVK